MPSPRTNPWRIFLASLALVLPVAAGGCDHSVVSADPQPNVAEAMKLREGAGGGEGAATAETAQPTGTGWGTLKGRFVYDGQPPVAARIDTGGKDPGVCDKHPLFNDSLVVGPDGGLANVVIYARKVSRVNDAAEKSGPHIFDQKDCHFVSHVYAVETGKEMIIKNSDPTGHNTKLEPPRNPPINPIIAAGEQAKYTFTTALTKPVDVTCSIHPWMKAYILARDNPYFAVTGPDGTFEIPDLPAGEPIEFQVWHERAPGGLDAQSGWKRGQFTMTVPEQKSPSDPAADLGEIKVAPVMLP